MACQRVYTGKAPGPDALPNEKIKFLPDTVHDLIFQLFKLMAKHSYTPKKWCISATKLIYKPNKTNPHNAADYRPITLVNCILKIWTSILTTIGTQTSGLERIFSDTADGFQSRINIYDSLSTHVTMYEDAKLFKQNIFTAYSDFGAFGGMYHRILFQPIEEYDFQDSYIATCTKLYAASSTYYMPIHGNTVPIQIHRGTLQGDTL